MCRLYICTAEGFCLGGFPTWIISALQLLVRTDTWRLSLEGRFLSDGTGSPRAALALFSVPHQEGSADSASQCSQSMLIGLPGLLSILDLRKIDHSTHGGVGPNRVPSCP